MAGGWRGVWGRSLPSDELSASGAGSYWELGDLKDKRWEEVANERHGRSFSKLPAVQPASWDGQTEGNSCLGPAGWPQAGWEHQASDFSPINVGWQHLPPRMWWNMTFVIWVAWSLVPSRHSAKFPGLLLPWETQRHICFGFSSFLPPPSLLLPFSTIWPFHFPSTFN